MLRRLVMLAFAAVVAAALWWRRNPSACPYGQRFWVEVPHPFISRERLREVLQPRLGERLLEIGPGTGYYTAELAEWVGPDGAVEIFDLQQKMLDHTLARVGERVGNITATQGDARSLPYPDSSFDAVVLTLVLGEIPDREAAIAEIARVLVPGGRLVVGELFGDPHFTTPATLGRLAAGAGLREPRRHGPWAGFFARLEKPAA